jgi:hypothetical protein
MLVIIFAPDGSHGAFKTAGPNFSFVAFVILLGIDPVSAFPFLLRPLCSFVAIIGSPTDRPRKRGSAPRASPTLSRTSAFRLFSLCQRLLASVR